MKSKNLRSIFAPLLVLLVPVMLNAQLPPLPESDAAVGESVFFSFLNTAEASDTPAYRIGSDTLGVVLNFLNEDIRFPTLPYYTYGSGLGITSPDSTFRLNIRFRMQNRVSLNLNQNTDDTVEGVVRRLRLRFDGFVGDPRFLYAIQLSFAPGDVGTVRDGENLNVIRDAMFFYRPNPKVNLGFGQTKLPGNRQRLNSSGALQLTDRSINNAQFTIDRDYGVHAYYLNEYSNAFSWNIKTAVSTGNGRNWTQDLSTDLAYTGRIEVMPFGEMGMFFEGDIRRNDTPRLLLAYTHHINQGAQRTQGQTGGTLFDTRDLTSIFFDAMLKYQGFAAMYAYMNRSVSGSPVTIATPFQLIDILPGPGSGGAASAVFAGNGHDVQLSYIFPSDYELIGRFSTQAVTRSVEPFYPNRTQYSFGLTRYIWEHALKLQAEVTRTETIWATGIRPDSNDWYLRFQVEIGI